jgi:hypothetical protein
MALRLITCLFAGFLASDRVGAAEPAVEYSVKAGYLINCLKFIEWPSTAFSSESSPITVGVMDREETFPVIQKALEGKFTGSHPIAVLPLREGQTSITNCHLIFVARSAGMTPEALQIQIGQHSILLVGETEDFAERGGVIGFVSEGEGIRLSLNLEAATAVGLKVNSKLAKVARLVKSKPANQPPRPDS